MANIASQKKRIVRSERERVENRRLLSTVRTYFRRLESAVADANADQIALEHKELVRRIDKAAQRGAIHANNAARKKSRASRLASGARS